MFYLDKCKPMRQGTTLTTVERWGGGGPFYFFYDCLNFEISSLSYLNHAIRQNAVFCLAEFVVSAAPRPETPDLFLGYINNYCFDHNLFSKVFKYV